MAPAGGMPPAAGAGRWKVVYGKGKWVEQTVEVEWATLDGDGSFAPVRLGRREPTAPSHVGSASVLTVPAIS